ncbi:SDR family NAD(P)-dependent oxidoreductase [Aestuariispira insulae]|uniref:NAD(P)-dependent dehydrogenase (Short-subunit alcohol dehydrogenase family) n=1 Tax=Aestuariispira insulae TaxID=1461337 RepID=A0A3D9HSS9_9PROT|nr:SDR family oxidoreductase [Aestuariispira insulae]RED52401.1 NAD(P)-dependent dehydrogenase (short-subunit alcohol dehydrogenase family) [Aestuariispira insulae]
MTDPAKKTVILTGASRGIGHATVQRFSNEGWQIITCSREDIPAHCKADPNWTHHIPTDLFNAESVSAFIKRANEILGKAPLHALVNNAAVSPKTPYKERLGCLNGDIARWREVFELNFFTPLTLCRGFASALHRGSKDSGGAIINITSIAGHAIHPFAGSAYSTSKAALSALTRELAVEFAELGVRVNAVAPGEIATEMIGPEYEPLIERIPMKRMGTADEVAGTVYQLCNADFGYVTGGEIFVTGGQHVY